MQPVKNYKFPLLLAILLIGLPVESVSQPSREERLSSHLSLLDVTSFAQDKFGHIWIGTLGGLNKYNGYEYEHFTNTPGDTLSLSSDFVLSLLYEDDSDALWVGTGGGLCRYNPGNEGFTQCVPNCAINSIYKDVAGMLWLATPIGAIRYDPQTEDSALQSPGIAFNLFWEDDRGKLWAGTKKDGLAIRTNRSIWETVAVPGGREVTSFFRGPEGCWWIGTDEGLLFFDPASRSFVENTEQRRLKQELSHTRINFLCEVEPMNILIGTATAGVYLYNIINQNLTHNSPAYYNPKLSSQAQTCFVDKNKMVWIGTYDKGFVSAKKQSDYFCQDQRLNAEIRNKFCTRVVPGNDGAMWIATRYDDIYRYQETGAFTRYSSGDLLGGGKDFLEDLLIDSKGKLWAAFESCLILARPEGSRLVPEKMLPLKNVRSIREGSDGTVWCGAWSGLYEVGRSGFLADQAICRIPGNIPEFIFENDGKMMVSVFSDHIYEYDPKEGTPQPLLLPEPYASIARSCISLFRDNRGNLWMGSYYYGLACVSPGGGLRRLTVDDGLPSNNVLCFQEDNEGYMWASTHSGIVRLGQGDSGLRVTTYNLRSVFPEEQYHEKSGGISPGGTIFFGGNHGVTYFRPSDVPERTHEPLVNIEDLKVFNKSFSPGKDINHTGEVTLSHRQNTITIDFAGIDYYSSNNLSYQYQLEGIDRDIVNAASHRRASYSNLPPGKYTFRVWAISEDGLVRSAPAALKIRVNKAPWLTTSALLMYFIFLAGLLTVLILTTVNSWKNRSRAQKEQMKTQFYSNISHELRTPLALIAAPAEQLLADPELTEKQRHLMDVINRNTSRLTKLTSQLMDLSKIENGTLLLDVRQENIIELLEIQCDSFQSWCAQKNISLTLHPHRKNFMMWVDADKLEKIMNNLLSNAVKHTQDGNIDVYTQELTPPAAEEAFGVSGNYLEISVADTGTGMSPENLTQLFDRFPKMKGSTADHSGNGIGLHYTKNLVEKHKGRIKASLRPVSGMEFAFILPLDEVYRADEMAASAPGEPDGQSSYPRLEPATEGTAPADAPHIVIVEDNPQLRAYLAQLLCTTYRITEAADGLAALDSIHEENPDLVLSDVIMPGADGYELCHKIKEDKEICHIPVVLLTARASLDEKIEGLENGADAYITKPFRVQELLYTIKNILHNKEVLRQKFFSIEAKNDYSGDNLNSKDQKFLSRLSEVVRQQVANPDFNVDDLATELGFSRTALFNKIKGLTGMSPKDFVRNYRFKIAASLIQEGELSLTEIADRTGFNSYSYFSKAFKHHFGISPKELRSQGREG